MCQVTLNQTLRPPTLREIHPRVADADDCEAMAAMNRVSSCGSDASTTFSFPSEAQVSPQRSHPRRSGSIAGPPVEDASRSRLPSPMKKKLPPLLVISPPSTQAGDSASPSPTHSAAPSSPSTSPTMSPMMTPTLTPTPPPMAATHSSGGRRRSSLLAPPTARASPVSDSFLDARPPAGSSSDEEVAAHRARTAPLPSCPRLVLNAAAASASVTTKKTKHAIVSKSKSEPFGDVQVETEEEDEETEEDTDMQRSNSAWVPGAAPRLPLRQPTAHQRARAFGRRPLTSQQRQQSLPVGSGAMAALRLAEALAADDSSSGDCFFELKL